MPRQNLILGKSGEEAAAGFLKGKGYKILKKNFKTKLGEIDIVALDKDTLCFVEVKSRNSLRFGLPKEAVSVFKQRRICRAALSYLKENNNFDKKARFDVVSVTYFKDSPEFDLVQDAFELGKGFTY